jgi:hypothetical protein
MNSDNHWKPFKSLAKRCVRSTKDYVILLTFHAFLPILCVLLGILRASPVLSL